MRLWIANIPTVEALLGLTATAYQNNTSCCCFGALDACLGALHHIGCDDVVCELWEKGMTSSPPALIK
jgi:hypothetical protein